jgi:SAM-dependent methyltransferase
LPPVSHRTSKQFEQRVALPVDLRLPKPAPQHNGSLQPGHAPKPDRDPADDPRLFALHRTLPQRDVPYLPTDAHVVGAMLDLAELKPTDVLYDLGCGDGRIVLEAARRGATAVGVDIDLVRIRECFENARKLGLQGRARFVRRSFFDTDLRDATVVTLYLLPAINVKLRPKLLRELRPGARVIANYYEIGDWRPDVEVDAHRRHLMKWIIPAWVSGRWHATLLGGAAAPRRHMSLDLHRRYQQVWGTARIGGREAMQLIEPTLRGDELSFTLYHPRQFRTPTRFVAKLEDEILRGSHSPGGAWVASRV